MSDAPAPPTASAACVANTWLVARREFRRAGPEPAVLRLDRCSSRRSRSSWPSRRCSSRSSTAARRRRSPSSSDDADAHHELDRRSSTASSTRDRPRASRRRTRSCPPAPSEDVAEAVARRRLRRRAHRDAPRRAGQIDVPVPDRRADRRRAGPADPGRHPRDRHLRLDQRQRPAAARRRSSRRPSSPPQVGAGGGGGAARRSAPASTPGRRIVGVVFVVLIFITLVIYGMWVAAGVVAEKSSRVMELLISAASPAAARHRQGASGIGLAGLVQYVAILVPALATLLLQDRIAVALLGSSSGARPVARRAHARPARRLRRVLDPRLHRCTR